ncbi:MAG: hypothetical protein OHK0019_32740 [Saprospiraceae bacterium]
MKLLKTTAHVNNLDELRQRKAIVKARLDAEQAELQATWKEIRSDLQPRKLMANFAESLLGAYASSGKTGFASNLQGPFRLAADLLIGNARTRLFLKIATPLVLTYLPRLTQKARGISLNKSKAKIYSTLRKGVSGLRSQLKRKKSDTSNGIEDGGDIIQPS